jgi:CRISPR-associated protein Cas5t
MLLSLVGVTRQDKGRHRGVEFALALEAIPELSKVFRKLRRGSDLEDTRPDYQDLLTDLRLWVWVRQGQDAAVPSLIDQLRLVLRNPAEISRSGGLSLGESSYLVDSISIRHPPQELFFVVPDPAGFYSLPTWVDHNTMQNTQLGRFRINDTPQLTAESLDSAWAQIPTAPEPPTAPTPPKSPGTKRTRKPK